MAVYYLLFESNPWSCHYFFNLVAHARTNAKYKTLITMFFRKLNYFPVFGWQWIRDWNRWRQQITWNTRSMDETFLEIVIFCHSQTWLHTESWHHQTHVFFRFCVVDFVDFGSQVSLKIILTDDWLFCLEYQQFPTEVWFIIFVTVVSQVKLMICCSQTVLFGLERKECLISELNVRQIEWDFEFWSVFLFWSYVRQNMFKNFLFFEGVSKKTDINRLWLTGAGVFGEILAG